MRKEQAQKNKQKDLPLSDACGATSPGGRGLTALAKRKTPHGSPPGRAPAAAGERVKPNASTDEPQNEQAKKNK